MARRRPIHPAFVDLEGRALLSALGPRPEGVERATLSPQRAGSSRKLADIVYTTFGGASQKLDVYRPAGTAPPDGWPVVLAIHGGGWRKFSKDQYGPKVAPALTRAGYAVVAPNYLLASPGSPSWPANFEQLRRAVEWIRSEAADLGFDPRRIAAMGESAGGHLAALLGTAPRAGQSDPARIQAVVSFYGPADLAALAAESSVGYIAARQMLGADASIDPDRYSSASPTSQATPGDAPMLIFQGTIDSILPPQQNQRLAAALNAAGVRNRLVLLPGAAHGFGFRARGRNLLPEILAFLRDTLRESRGNPLT
jgi:acetyl esterase/lipase